MKPIPEAFLTTPVVYLAGSSYRIIVPVTCETVMWVQVGNRCFYDDANGVLRSAKRIHTVSVPQELLDREKTYTVCYRVVSERKPYFTEASDVLYYPSPFRPVAPDAGEIRIYHVADAHNRVEEPVAAARYFGEKLDLLILNGDIPNHSGKIEYFSGIHQIAAQVTNGEIPVVFSRGNHDTRGVFAEQFSDYTPTDNGLPYFTFRAGPLWGIVLDCGEDKPDAHPEYGNMNCFEDFRRRETEFLLRVAENGRSEFAADGVRNRLVVCHVPFTEKFKPPFDIEEDTYREWARILREKIRPQLMLCGHIHQCYISEVGGEKDDKGQPCPVVVASRPQKEGPFWGGAFTLRPGQCDVRFTDSGGAVSENHTILFGKPCERI